MLASLDFPPPPSIRSRGNATARSLSIPGPLLLEVRRFADPRGEFSETYSARDFAEFGITETFVQDNASLSRLPGTVRGLHFQAPPRAQAKLVRVTRGAILDVAVDIRRTSPHFGRHVAVTLSAGDGRMLYVPAGFAHGFCTLEANTEVAYKASDFYAPELDGGVLWSDPELGITWPVATHDAVLSDKDRKLPALHELHLAFA